MSAATSNAASAMLHQGRYNPAVKLSNAVTIMEIKSFIMLSDYF